jgi:hypothetical protein
VREVLRQTFKYDPTIRKKAEEEGMVEEGVVRLDPFLVTERKGSPFLVSHMDHQRELFEANKPSLSNGIEILSTPRASIGVKSYNYDFMPSGSLPRWTLINLRF